MSALESLDRTIAQIRLDAFLDSITAYPGEELDAAMYAKHEARAVLRRREAGLDQGQLPTDVVEAAAVLGMTREDVAEIVAGAIATGDVLDDEIQKAAEVFEVPVPPKTLGHRCDERGRVADEPLDGVFSDRAYPLFGHIRQYARAKRINPTAALHAVLQRLTMAVPPTVVLPDLTGGFGSLNSLLAFCAMSGGGKSVIEEAAARMVMISGGLLSMGEDIPTPNLGSGQGLAGAYLTWNPAAKRLQQDKHTMLFRVGEVGELVALMDGGRTSLGATLREAFSGAPLGNKNADAKLDRHVPRHSYRLGLTVGVQHKLAEPLVNEYERAAGTTGRFEWVTIRDRYAARADCRPQTPGIFPWVVPTVVVPDGETFRVVDICPAAREAIDSYQLAVHLGEIEPDELEAHAMFRRLKLASRVALAAGRIDQTCRDWEIAGLLMAESDKVCAEVCEVVESVAAAQAAKIGTMRGAARRHEDVAYEKAGTDMVEVGGKVMTELVKAGPAGLTTGQVAHKLSTTQRRLLSAVLDALSAADPPRVRSEDGRQAGSKRWWAV